MAFSSLNYRRISSYCTSSLFYSTTRDTVLKGTQSHKGHEIILRRLVIPGVILTGQKTDFSTPVRQKNQRKQKNLRKFDDLTQSQQLQYAR